MNFFIHFLKLKPAIVALLLGAVVLLGLVLGVPLPPVPSFPEVRAVYRPSEAQLLDRYGQLLHELRTDETRRRFAWTPMAEISPALQPP